MFIFPHIMLLIIIYTGMYLQTLKYINSIINCNIVPIYINQALKKWKQNCETMGIPINDKFIYTLLFADEQAVIAMYEQDSSYTLRKLHEQYKNWELDMNYEKTEQLVIGRERKDIELGPNTIWDSVRFKYLGVMLMK